jgi:hypothetical protein
MPQDELNLIFRCPPELVSVLPRPIPAIQGLPGWFKEMPATFFDPVSSAEDQTVKRCPPFIDAMTAGFLIPLPCDIRVENGMLSWDLDLPVSSANIHLRSPMSFHHESQVSGTPFHQPGRMPVKFHNFWTIEAPEGFSVLFTHPVNRSDLPFTTLTGIVDCDRYIDNRIHFPAHWHDTSFKGVLPKGTPIVQCIPVKRESWTAKIESLTDDGAARIRELALALISETGVYRRDFRASKR